MNSDPLLGDCQSSNSGKFSLRLYYALESQIISAFYASRLVVASKRQGLPANSAVLCSLRCATRPQASQTLKVFEHVQVLFIEIVSLRHAGDILPNLWCACLLAYFAAVLLRAVLHHYEAASEAHDQAQIHSLWPRQEGKLPHTASIAFHTTFRNG